MKIVVQRVSKSNVEINGRIYSEINAGLLILLGIQTGDTEKEADYLSKKIPVVFRQRNIVGLESLVENLF